mmetsp:Transcript_10546/g.17209  ORF Transcript_10546/g.17209 Transcript_10546/m.17209 type:complete len:302 (-) Transcript_10546:923-1828(-)
MQCTMPQKNLRVFASCIQCLAKTGKELVMEAGKENGNGVMKLSTMNDSKTAFCVFTFFDAFFERFLFDQAAQGSVLAVKITLKSCLSAVKSIRNTERLTISFIKDGARHVAVFASHCTGGLVKTHELHYEDTSIVHATFDRKQAKNQINARARIFSKALGHIFGSEEALVSVNKDSGLLIRSHYQYVDRVSELQTLKTSITIDRDDLDVFEVEENPKDVAFGLRELRALLAFCEAAEILTMAFFFNEPGTPFLFSSNETNQEVNYLEETNGGQIQTFMVELIMATLDYEEYDPAAESQRTQ